MWDCFTDTPDYAPFVAVPANVPLDQMNPPAHALADPVARRDALASARMNFREVDKAPEDALNRILWRAMKGSGSPTRSGPSPRARTTTMTSPVRFTLNGRPVAIEAAPGESLLDALRERCGVTSIKDGCQPQGQCGCCLALIDGRPLVTCAFEAHRAEGRTC